MLVMFCSQEIERFCLLPVFFPCTFLVAVKHLSFLPFLAKREERFLLVSPTGACKCATRHHQQWGSVRCAVCVWIAFRYAIKISNIVKTNKKFIEYAMFTCFSSLLAVLHLSLARWTPLAPARRFIVLFIVGEKSNICGWQLQSQSQSESQKQMAHLGLRSWQPYFYVRRIYARSLSDSLARWPYKSSARLGPGVNSSIKRQDKPHIYIGRKVMQSPIWDENVQMLRAERGLHRMIYSAAGRKCCRYIVTDHR